MTKWMKSGKVNKSQIIIVWQYSPLHPHFECFASRRYLFCSRAVSVLLFLDRQHLGIGAPLGVEENGMSPVTTWLPRLLTLQLRGQLSCLVFWGKFQLWVFPLTHSVSTERKSKRLAILKALPVTVTHWMEQRTLFSTFLGSLFLMTISWF